MPTATASSGPGPGNWTRPWLGLVFLILLESAPLLSAAVLKQESLDEWRMLTATNSPLPRVYVRSGGVRFLFEAESNVIGFSARLHRFRIPTRGYHVNSAVLRWDPVLSASSGAESGWQRATVIAGAEWRRLSTNLILALAPERVGHGVYYQGLLAERLIYRAGSNSVLSAKTDAPPPSVVVDRRLSPEETLQRLANLIQGQLAQSHPASTCFVLMAPDLRRFPQTLLLDTQRRRCVWLSPSALFDPNERGFSLARTTEGLSTLVFESHGLALIKNPVSCALRLGDLGIQTVVRFLRFPLPRNGPPPVQPGPGMDLAQWELWLDRYTGTRQENGLCRLLVDGDRFFPRLEAAIRAATNQISFETYIFDKDDVAVGIAGRLKQRARQVKVRVILDQMGSTAAALIPPATPLPPDFVAPKSISSYLRQGSAVRVRPFLNPWFSVDHLKVYLVDGNRAWIGGMNIGREYRYEWHDVMVELSGPVVASLERGFERHWAHEGPLGDVAYTGRVLAEQAGQPPAPAPGPWAQLRLLPTRTLWKPFSAAVQEVLKRARSYVYIENPYLFDRRIIRDLVQARNRGVDVRVVLPRVNDFSLGERSNLVVGNYLQAHGVRVFFYPGMTHVKALLADDWACLGSGNLNHLSLRLCQEQNLATSDPVFVGELKANLFETDFAQSYELKQPVPVDWLDYLADLALEGF
jgi:cardiolipin synthase